MVAGTVGLMPRAAPTMAAPPHPGPRPRAAKLARAAKAASGGPKAVLLAKAAGRAGAAATGAAAGGAAARAEHRPRLRHKAQGFSYCLDYLKTRMNHRFALHLAVGLGFVGLLTACDPNRVFEENTDFATSSWDVQQKPAFTFAIADTTARYDVYFNVRYAPAYGYYNLYLQASLKGPAGLVGRPMLHQLLLLDPKTGEPKGKGTGDIYDLQALAMPNQHFAKAGNYTITLEQYMRQDQLPGLMAVGVRVAKHVAGSK